MFLLYFKNNFLFGKIDEIVIHPFPFEQLYRFDYSEEKSFREK